MAYQILSGSFPDVLLQKHNSIGQYNEEILAWTVLLHAYSFALVIDYNFCQDFLPSASFKTCEKFSFSCHLDWIILCEIVHKTSGRSIAKMWLKEKTILGIDERYFKNSFLCIFLSMFEYASVNILHAT